MLEMCLTIPSATVLCLQPITSARFAATCCWMDEVVELLEITVMQNHGFLNELIITNTDSQRIEVSFSSFLFKTFL